MKDTDQFMQDTDQSHSLETCPRSAQPNSGSMYVERTGALNVGRAALDTMVSIATLTVQESDQGDQRWFDVQLNQHPLKLGRTAQGGQLGPNDIVLEALFVARDLARIEPAGLGHSITELGAPNRLTIQDRPPGTQPYMLRDGDVLELRHAGSSAVVPLTYRNRCSKLPSSRPSSRVITWIRNRLASRSAGRAARCCSTIQPSRASMPGSIA